jgi:hypothetical protein
MWNAVFLSTTSNDASSTREAGFAPRLAARAQGYLAVVIGVTMATTTGLAATLYGA